MHVDYRAQFWLTLVMQTTSASPDIDDLVTRIYESFRELMNSVAQGDATRHRHDIEEGIAEILSHRTGWALETKGHFIFNNEANLFIDPTSTDSTGQLILETAKRVLRIELEPIVQGTATYRSEQIKRAVSRLLSDYDWHIYFRRKRLD